MSATSGQVEVPDIGDFDGVPVIEILVSVGDTVAAEDPLVTLESDKATMDVPAPYAGTVREISVAIGDSVAQGAALMVIEPSADGDAPDPVATEPAPDSAATEPAPTDAATEPAPADAPESIETAPPTPGESGPPADQGGERASRHGDLGPIYASPSVRRLARELGIDLRGVDGSGRRGRVTKEDVHGIAEGIRPARRGADAPAAPPAAGSRAGGGAPAGGGLDLLPWPSIDFEKQGPVERVPRTRIQNISARNLARNWAMIPHVTQNDEADITELETWRTQLNDQFKGEVKFTMVTFLVAASVAALKAFPTFNSSLDGDELVLKRYFNIGFAADTPNGLVVPVIRDADRKGLKEIAGELTDLSAKARDGKLSPAEMSGATFTISSLGGIGGTSFTPIINAPEVAILGVTRSAIKPVWNGSEFAPRLMVPLSLSYDHRVIDGATAARFCVFLARTLSDLRRVLL